MIIFYDGLDTDKNTYAKTLYCFSESNRKIIDIIVANIKKCINMLQKIDSSLWDGIVNKLSENMKNKSYENALQNLEDTIKKFNFM